MRILVLLATLVVGAAPGDIPQVGVGGPLRKPLPVTCPFVELVFPLDESPYQLRVGRLDGDARADLVVVTDSSMAGFPIELRAYVVTEDEELVQTWRESVESNYGGAPDARLRLVDLDADGDLDVGATNADYMLSWLNDGSAGFQSAGGTNLYGGYLGDLVFTDINGAPYPDLYAVVDDFFGLYVDGGTGDGDGTFTPCCIGLAPTVCYPSQIELAPLDSDDIDDLVMGCSAGLVIRVSGDGEITGLLGEGVWGIATEDLDADGDVDIAATAPLDHNVYVFMNDGSGAFGPPLVLPTDRQPQAVVAADLDGDGRNDLVTANTLGGNLTLYYGAPGGDFRGPCTVPVGARPLGLGADDVDADGDIDIVVGNSQSNTLSVLLNAKPR